MYNASKVALSHFYITFNKLATISERFKAEVLLLFNCCLVLTLQRKAEVESHLSCSMLKFRQCILFSQQFFFVVCFFTLHRTVNYLPENMLINTFVNMVQQG